ncbi:MAG: HP0268 family nuclease [Campylobacterota bacterium]|nr:HP0268 family nuclease [Campylobacterota bacterium]
MEILLARRELSLKPKKVNFEKLLDKLAVEDEEIFYFDRDNSHKDMMAIVDKFEESGYNVHFREVKFGLSDEEYLYEIHAL